MNHSLTDQPAISSRMLIGLAIAFGVTLFFSNGVYLYLCLLTMLAIIGTLWRNGRPGILIFSFFMQWTQVVTYVIWMDVNDWPIDRLSPHAGIAVLLSCVGLYIMALILAVGIKKMYVPSDESMAWSATLFNEKKLITLYLISTLFLGGIGFIFGNTSGFAQILVTLSSLKWIFFMLYGFVVLLKKGNRLILYGMIVFEFVTGLYSYFSSFKEVILITIVLSLTFIRRVSGRQLVYSLLLGALLSTLLFTWTAIKGEYRHYLNAGTRKQEINVSREAAFDKIGQQVSDLSWNRYQQAMNLSLYRLQYVFHLAKTMDRVPSVMPYENGQLWANNLSYVLVPRLLDPDKPIFDASIKTNKYTGMHYSGLKQGASFGLGYFADGYIDFGYIGMMLPLALLALLLVVICQTFYHLKKLNILMRYCLINASLFSFQSFESDAIYMVGRLVITFLVFWLLGSKFLPMLQNWLYKK
jgi:hypothetical protein